MTRKTNLQLCAKQDMNMQLMRKLISHVFTQDMTWMHAADKKTPHNTWGQKSTRPSELETAHSHKETELGAQVSEPRHETETQDMSAGIRTPRSNIKQCMQTRERTARAQSKPRAHMKTGHDGSLSQNSWITLDQSDRTLTAGVYV